MFDDGALILIAVMVLVLIALAIGLFTSYGSGIAPRPWAGGAGTAAPGADGPEETSGRDEGEHAPVQHGTR
jgi:hypothetical protein